MTAGGGGARRAVGGPRARGGAERSLELVRRSLLQGEGLPFADALTAEQMPQAFDEEGVSFGRDDHAANVASARGVGGR